ncbi:MAG: Rieske 2Fe-2S domain-containing protein, partial [Proteobacteria bacterium]|nr:Rieske 2Fe-2S domain-containing protein [Pseudomonadota bacterium]
MALDGELKTTEDDITGDVDLATTMPGTPGGKFMRQFWVAVDRAEDLPAGRAKPIRIMGEDYALYRGESGKAQVIAYRCPHRGAQMHLGWVEGEEIRCVYHGWKFDCSGQCTEQPAEEAGFARKVQIATYPTEEHMGQIFAYFGEGEPPAFPPFPAPEEDGIIDAWKTEVVPCNYLQAFENSMDEVHVSFVHRDGGTHAAMHDLPLISAEETDWGMLRKGTRSHGGVRHTLHYAPNCTRVIVPPSMGMDGIGGWAEIYFSFTPIDDENHLWLITSHVKVTGKEADEFREKRAEFWKTIGESRPALDVAVDLMAGKGYFQDVQHPDLAILQDIAVQAGQGRIADRTNERLGRSDNALILWRKIMARELRLIAAGRTSKRWSPAP